ncbi:hypothetical protein [Nonomuraea sp. B5E05]|uniref:hypothetical protein n=1 Tax=Nonomuraea sp. B5E05 TaxID=3153569 RepID=UPI00326127B1
MPAASAAETSRAARSGAEAVSHAARSSATAAVPGAPRRSARTVGDNVQRYLDA